MPSGSRPPLHPRWQLSNHVRVCTRLCVHCAWLLFYPGVDIFHWGGSLVNECSGPWCEWLFSSPVQLGSCWSIARLNCWNNSMNMLVMLWLLSIVKKKINNFMIFLIFLWMVVVFEMYCIHWFLELLETFINFTLFAYIWKPEIGRNFGKCTLSLVTWNIFKIKILSLIQYVTLFFN